MLSIGPDPYPLGERENGVRAGGWIIYIYIYRALYIGSVNSISA